MTGEIAAAAATRMRHVSFVDVLSYTQHLQEQGGERAGAWLVAKAIKGEDVDADNARSQSLAPFLTDPDWHTPLSDSEIATIVRAAFDGEAKMRELPDDAVWRRVVAAKASDKEYQECFPPRSSNDLRIRRGRIADAARVWARHDAARWKEMVEEAYRYSWDYIMLANIVGWAWCARKRRWWERMHAVGVLPGGFEAFTKRASSLTAVLKTRRTTLERHLFAESGTLVGYRQPPIPGFDRVAESKALAESVGRGLTGGISAFRLAMERALAMRVVEVAYLSFEDYVASGLWVTGGSSSLGRVEVEVDGVSETIKARKNMVREIYTDEDLMEFVEAHKEQVNYAILKSELGKLRIAVAGDLATYLRMSWMVYLLGGAYTQWVGSTTEESMVDEANRLVDMLRALADAWGVPFDFDKFDRQPTTEELVAILDWLVRHARRNVPARGWSRFDREMLIVRRGMLSATLVVRSDEGSVEEVRVQGGLMSGLKITTIVGNAWNSVVTQMVIDAYARLGVEDLVARRWIRGDDSAIVCDSWVKAALTAEGYGWMNAKGGVGKFSVWHSEFEFLRLWISDRVAGNAVRQFAGWNQRKPWGAEPWAPAAEVAAQAALRDSLVRRGADVDDVWELWRSSSRAWSRHARVDVRWLGVPVALGGLGLEPWSGWRPSRPFPGTGLPAVRVINSCGREAAAVASDAAVWRLKLSADAARRVADRRLAVRLLGDGVPAIVAATKAATARPAAEWRKTEVTAPRVSAGGWDSPARLKAESNATSRERRSGVGWFGWARKWAGAWKLWSELSRETGVAPAQMLKREAPGVWLLLVRLEGRGLRRREALAWLFGETSVPLCGLNEKVGSVVTDYVVDLLGDITKRRWGGGFGAAIYVYAKFVCSALARSEWYTRLWQW